MAIRGFMSVLPLVARALTRVNPYLTVRCMNNASKPVFSTAVSLCLPFSFALFLYSYYVFDRPGIRKYTQPQRLQIYK